MRLLPLAFTAGLLGAGLFLFAQPVTAQPPAYHAAGEYKLGGAGGWDYLTDDTAAHRLYVSHGTRVEVIDTLSGQPVGAIDSLAGVHGIALSTDGTTGYISDGRANQVIVFARPSLAILARIPVGDNPDGIVFEPETLTVWAFNGHSHSVSVISALQRIVVATLALPGKPEFPVTDGKGTVFVPIENRNVMLKLRSPVSPTQNVAVVAIWPLPGCESPSGTAIDTAHHRLFSVCDGNVMAITDSLTGAQIARVAIGAGPDAAAFNPRTGLAYASNGGGTLTVVDTTRAGFPATQVPTRRGARTMALDTATGAVYLSTADFGAAPAPTADHPHPRPSAVPGSFTVLVYKP